MKGRKNLVFTISRMKIEYLSCLHGLHGKKNDIFWNQHTVTMFPLY